MTSLDDMRREIREKHEKISGLNPEDRIEYRRRCLVKGLSESKISRKVLSKQPHENIV